MIIDATKAGLSEAVEDYGVRYTFYFLARLVAAARQDDWQTELADLGISLESRATPLDLALELQSAIDSHLLTSNHSTDFSEMAQQAAGEALASVVHNESLSLFEPEAVVLRKAVRRLSTKAGFADLGQAFFASFMFRFLSFYTCRIAAEKVGGKNWRQVSDISEFNAALGRHCRESAYIVRDFCGQWYSKTEYREGVNIRNASRFVAVALKKLSKELECQKAGR